MRKIIATIFSVTLFLISTITISANHDTATIIDQGNFGIEWYITDNGTLVHIAFQ